MNISIIGSGNVASVLGRMFKESGHTIDELFSRNMKSGEELAKELTATFRRDPQELTPSSDIYLVAISDDALAGLKHWLKLKDQLVVHTAGSVSIEVLKDCSSNYGIIYPLQSLRKELPIPSIPFLVDSNKEANTNTILTLLQNTGSTVVKADNEQRKKIHLAAVIANNFSNHLFALTENYCAKENLDFSLIQPLLEETVERLSGRSAQTLQTGPAIRKDVQTIAKQRDMLTAYPRLLDIYDLFTKSISEASTR